MKILQLVAADGWSAVFDAEGSETEVHPIVAWALVQAEAGHQYLAPLVLSGSACGHSDAREDLLFLRATRTRDFSPSKRAAHWLKAREIGTITCGCKAWDSDLCAGRSSTWDPDAPRCGCECHTDFYKG